MILAHTLPVLCALIYTIAVLFTKRAIAEGAGIMRMSFLTNVLCFVLFVPVFLVVDGHFSPEGWEMAMLTGSTEFFGSMFLLAGVRLGDVSVQTPLMGIKVIFVALLTTLVTGAPIPFSWWVGASLAFLAILILGLPDLLKRSISILSIIYVVLGCLCFALADVLMQENAPLYGGPRFVFLTFLFLATLSLMMIPFFHRGLKAIPTQTWKWVFAGSGLMALQLVGLFVLIVIYGKATVINIIYSSRGIWSIVAVWVIGHWFANTEKKLGKGVLVRRLVGAGMLCLAIAIVLAYE